MIAMAKKLNVGICLFDGAEVLDFAGPFEVFSVCSELCDHTLFNVFTVAKDLRPIRAVNGLSVNPKYVFSNAPKIDILIIPGGEGARVQMKDKEVLNWIDKMHETTTYTISICSGALLLGVLGLLDGNSYCTHREVYDDLKKIVPSGYPRPEKRYVQSSEMLYTSGGISAGIDLSFHIVELLHGKKIAEQTAYYMEYEL